MCQVRYHEVPTVLLLLNKTQGPPFLIMTLFNIIQLSAFLPIWPIKSWDERMLSNYISTAVVGINRIELNRTPQKEKENCPFEWAVKSFLILNGGGGSTLLVIRRGKRKGKYKKKSKKKILLRCLHCVAAYWAKIHVLFCGDRCFGKETELGSGVSILLIYLKLESVCVLEDFFFFFLFF